MTSSHLLMSLASRAATLALLVMTPLRVALAQLPAGTPRPSAAVVAARVDSIVNADILRRGFPSVSIVVTRGGETLLERAWGVANLTTGQKAEPSTTYRIGSVSKQFTAALVLKLVDRGRLSLTDSIGRYLTGLRPEWKAITVEQLLNHTSGLPRDYLDVSRAMEDMSAEALIALAARDTLMSAPGTANAYSNTGYMLLGVLAAKLYGKPYAAALRDEIARPLGLVSLTTCDEADPAHAAAGYVRLSDGSTAPPNEQHLSQTVGPGGICATAGDLAKWNRALHGGRVVSAASYTAMTTPRGVAAKVRYGFGLSVVPAPWGSPALLHDGQTHGFSSHNGWYPAESLSVTLLYNARPRLEQNMANVVGLVALGGTPAPSKPVAALELPAAATQGEGRPKLVGAYELSAGRTFIVSFEDGQLWVTPPGATKQRLILQSGTTYAVGSAESSTTATFMIDADGEVSGFTARQNGMDRTLKKIK